MEGGREREQAWVMMGGGLGARSPSSVDDDVLCPWFPHPLVVVKSERIPSDCTRANYNKIFSSDSSDLFKDPNANNSRDENKHIQPPATDAPQAYSAVNKQKQNSRDRGDNMKSLMSWDS